MTDLKQNQHGGQTSLSIEDARRLKAQHIGGEALTPTAKARVEDLKKIRAIEERAQTLGITTAQYILEMTQGKKPLMDVPQPYIDFIVQNPNMATSDFSSDLPAKGIAEPAYQAPPNQSITAAQKSQEPASLSIDDLARMGLLNDINASVGSAMSTNAEHGSPYQIPPELKKPSPSIEQVLKSKTVSVPTAVGNLDISHLTSSMWRNSETMLKFEQLVSCLVDLRADGKQIRKFQEAINRHGPKYLDELTRRFQWRVLFMQNRQRMGVQDLPSVEKMLSAYEKLLQPMAEFVAKLYEVNNGQDTSADTELSSRTTIE